MKNKRERLMKDKRDIQLSEEDELDFVKLYRQHFFGQHENLWDNEDDDLLALILEEIKLEGSSIIAVHLDNFLN